MSAIVFLYGQHPLMYQVIGDMVAGQDPKFVSGPTIETFLRSVTSTDREFVSSMGLTKVRAFLREKIVLDGPRFTPISTQFLKNQILQPVHEPDVLQSACDLLSELVKWTPSILRELEDMLVGENVRRFI